MNAQEKLTNQILRYRSDPVAFIKEVIGVDPTPQQIQLILSATRENARTAVKSCTSSGKALRHGEKIHTPSGLTAIEDLKVGDLVCNTRGSFSQITGVFPQGLRECYRVYFNNGTSVDCDGDHQWTVSSYHSNTGFTTLTLKEILKRGIYVEDKSTGSSRLKYYLPNIDPIYKLTPESLSLNPYVLGVWLGDGARNTSRVTNIDSDLWERIENLGYPLSEYSGQTRTIYNLITDLKKLGISDCYSFQKFIPSEYLSSSSEVRIELLRGLMDTDGTVSKEGHLTFYSTSRKLAEDFVYLVRSLGGSTKGINTKRTTHRDCYVIHFQLNTYDRIFWIERKQNRVRKLKTYGRVYIERIEPIGKHEATCISVDAEDSLYICENFIPTHNTAVLAWLTLYFLVCFTDCRMLATAPTANQLHRVFRSEVAKWLATMRAPYCDFYELMSERIFLKGKKKDTQFCGFVTGSVENKESFAGLHGKKVVVLVDEASALPNDIFDTLVGTLSSGSTSFILVSNPVRSSGSFFDLFANEENAKRWDLITFTSYDAPHVNQEWIDEVIAYYGADSDFVRMRVYGEFPVLSNSQFISSADIDAAAKRKLDSREYYNFPRYLSADVARFGDDQSVLVDRQGPKVHSIEEYKGLDTVQFADVILKKFRTQKYNGVFVDGIGVGAGVVDQLKRFQIPVIEVIANSKSTDPKTYSNLRSQIYGRMRDWLSTADIPEENRNLREDLAAINYFFNGKLQIVLEAKKDMKKRLGRSPDCSDALALSFAGDIYFAGARVRTQPIPVKKSNFLWA